MSAKLTRFTGKYRLINKNYSSISKVVPRNSHYWHIQRRYLTLDCCLYGNAGRAKTVVTSHALSKLHAQQLVFRLDADERNILIEALEDYKYRLTKSEYEQQLARSKWREKYGYPKNLPSLRDVNPVGNYCEIPVDWYQKKIDKSTPPLTAKDLFDVGFANSIPFIMFGFLDNSCMLVFGDYIDMHLGVHLGITTMTAAAIGNTLSDVVGIGTAFHIEKVANKFKYKTPKLTAGQINTTGARNAANVGRVLGVTLGCILGMLPLLLS